MFFLRIYAVAENLEAINEIELKYRELLNDFSPLYLREKQQYWKFPELYELSFSFAHPGNLTDTHVLEKLNIIGTKPTRINEETIIWAENTGSTFVVEETEWVDVSFLEEQ